MRSQFISRRLKVSIEGIKWIVRPTLENKQKAKQSKAKAKQKLSWDLFTNYVQNGFFNIFTTVLLLSTYKSDFKYFRMYLCLIWSVFTVLWWMAVCISFIFPHFDSLHSSFYFPVVCCFPIFHIFLYQIRCFLWTLYLLTRTSRPPGIASSKSTPDYFPFYMKKIL